ncbi:aminotransferase class V-fold PLP-dependent enzyme [Thalassoroseus pseudoceratinae]|uniref:aminotransferase class V-fold PLP-dependent enzyme n=1 Tax=Thalassoroseus pseudoceratinae TaxID=2713176 RepID=UPI001423F98F|nr:aminotransferase class V-fold PLP-dependent enzyme [Thalassoroseus pseudoceratinae]
MPPQNELLDDTPWQSLREQWLVPEDVTYLNHGSFGPSPRVVRESRQQWCDALEREPMDFFLRQYETELERALEKLGKFVGASARELVFVDNATFGMNVVAAQIELSAGDEVVLTDHEYGAVFRIWRDLCQASGAELKVARLPFPLTDPNEIVEAVQDTLTDRTKILVVSHVTSATATNFPVEDICQLARKRGVPTCVDGPHAIAMVPLNLRELGCDYYVASCHKWLSAPFGTGFLYMAKRHTQKVLPVVRSWGGSLSGQPSRWQDEFQWIGTRDPSNFLAVPTAIEFLEDIGIQKFRDRTHALAEYARSRIEALTGLPTFLPNSSEWYGSMISLPIPPSNDPDVGGVLRDPLQTALWERERIEVPVFHWHERRFIRVSCHLYTSTKDIDRLVDSLQQHLPEFSKSAEE